MESPKSLTKTSMQKALTNIKVAYILAFVSGAITLLAVIVALTGDELVEGVNAYAFVDVAIVLIAAVFLAVKKSRVAAIIILVHFLASKILQFTSGVEVNGAAYVVAALFAMGYICGVMGTFSYHKLKDEENTVAVVEEKAAETPVEEKVDESPIEEK